MALRKINIDISILDTVFIFKLLLESTAGALVVVVADLTKPPYR